MTIALHIKKGATFTRKCSYSSGGVPVNLTGSTIKASLRDRSLTLVDNLTVNLGVQSGATLGTFTLTATPVDTLTWPAGALSCDIRIEDSLGAVVYTDTFFVQVENAVTPP